MKSNETVLPLGGGTATGGAANKPGQRFFRLLE